MYDSYSGNPTTNHPTTDDNTLSPNLIKEVHMYILPINDKTVDFCQQLGISPTQDHLKKWPNLFAYLVNIKHVKYTGA